MSRASSQKVNAELFSLEPTAMLEFFVIYYDYVNAPDEKLYIHGGTNGIETSVYWQGQEYVPFPIQSSGFESKGDGTLPRPKLTVSNQDFFISNLIRRYNNLVGAKIVRKRTFVKFLDDRNFSDSKNPYGAADSTVGLEDQVFYILRRSSESRAIVEFELASPLELENVNFPRRTVMARYCSFHYRGNGCRYLGGPIAEENNYLLSIPTDIRSGLIKRYYPSAASSPADSSEFTSKIKALTCSSESVVTTLSLDSADNYYLEFFGYFKVDKGQAGEYAFAITADDAAEILIDGKVICGEYGTGGVAGGPPISGTSGTNGTGSYSYFSGSYATNIYLAEGYHRILYRFYESTGSQEIFPFYIPPGTKVENGNWVAIPTSRYYYDLGEVGVLTSSQSFGSNGSIAKSIGLNKGAIKLPNDKGKWTLNTAYKTGDFVYVENHNIKVAKDDINDSPNWEPLHKVYVCLENHTSSSTKSPYFNKQYWIADQCSKTIDGCRLRFGRESHLPFGGFPGTEEYSISQ